MSVSIISEFINVDRKATILDISGIYYIDFFENGEFMFSKNYDYDIKLNELVDIAHKWLEKK